MKTSRYNLRNRPQQPSIEKESECDEDNDTSKPNPNPNHHHQRFLLMNVLKNSKKNHKVEIMTSKDLKDAHIYCKVHQLSGQISGPLLEYFMIEKFKMEKNEASKCIGDVRYKNQNYEIKTSLGGHTHTKFNYIQIRFNHDCDYLLTAYYLSDENVDTSGELFIFKLNKKEMKDLIVEFGGYAHGTKQKLGEINHESVGLSNNDKEYALHLQYNGRCWEKLLLKRIENF
jgi:hypothetical protein